MKIKDRVKALTGVLSNIEKQFGQGAIMLLGSVPSGADVPSISSGSLRLDRAIGTGGYPRGRLVEIFGPESSGKTTLALHAIAEVQKTGGICAFVDAEHALDVTYARKLGVDADKLLVSQPDYGEQALDILDMLVRSGEVDLVVVDSVAALTPKAELEGEMGDHHVGLQARMMSQAMRKLTGVTHKLGSTIIFINQMRQKIGVPFGNPETTTGGNALKFYASVRLDVRRIGHVKDGADSVGSRVRVKVVKNKMAPPFKQAELEIRYGEGISALSELIDLSVEIGTVEKSGAWLSIDGEKIGQGKEKAIVHLKEHPKLAETLFERLNSSAGSPAIETGKEEGEDGKAA